MEANLINGRTIEEIKNNLEQCSKVSGCAGCEHLGDLGCVEWNMRSALALIKHLEAKQPKWISVEERLPENEERVLITEWHEGFYGKPWCVVMTAFHTDGKTLAQDSDYNWSEGSVEMRYDEEADDFIVPEGWWEDVQYGDEFSMVDAKVTHWMPLPEPKENE